MGVEAGDAKWFSGIRSDVFDRILNARSKGGHFVSVVDFTRRTGLGRAAVMALTEADAFWVGESGSQGGTLASAWAGKAADSSAVCFSGVDSEDDNVSWILPLTPQQEVTEDYRSIGLSLRAHPIFVFTVST